MNTQLQPDSNIPLDIYQLASKHNLGTPIKRHRRKLITIMFCTISLVGIIWLGWLAYQIYGYIAFIVLSHIYPDRNTVPANQIDNYLWLQNLHDNLWTNGIRLFAGLVSLTSSYLKLSTIGQAKLYICTEGLLKIYRKRDEGVRWDEVKELFISKGTVDKLVKLNDSTFDVPSEQLSDFTSGKKLNNLIINEITRYLLPNMLDKYKRDETVTFGKIEIKPKGINRPGGLLYWEQIGDVTLEKNTLSIYYNSILSNKQIKEQYSPVLDDKWQTWRKDVLAYTSWPNIPAFVTMANAILAHQDIGQIHVAHLIQQSRFIPAAVIHMKKRSQKRRLTAIALTAMTVLVIISLLAGLIIHETMQEQALQAQATKDTKLLQNHFTQLAHKAYAVHVPGEHCGNSKNFWLDGDTQNAYTCENDGLLMTQKNTQYIDGEYFTIVPDTLLNDSNDFSSINYFPHDYRVQVQTTILYGEPSTCVSVEVHIQDFQGGQWFSICADGSWYYSRCDLQCNTSIQVANGNLAHASHSYLIRVDVTDTMLSLYVNNTKVTSINDSTYHTTNQLEIGVYGNKNVLDPNTALFSDFSYTPSP